MKRFAALLLILALVGTLLPAPVSAQDERISYSLSVVGDNGDAITANATCRVMTADSNAAATIYSDPALQTTQTNPITVSSAGGCTWFGSATSYDVLVLGNGGDYKGSIARVEAVSRTGAKRVVLQRNTRERVLAIPFSRSTSSALSTSSYTIPKGALIKDVVVETITAVAASTLNVSYVGAASDLALCSVATTATANGFANCSTTATLLSSSAAITYNTQDHDSAGYLWVRYLETALGP